MSTYTPIASQTLSSATASVTFGGIPQDYTDLVLVMSVQGASTATSRDPGIRFNSDTGSNYSYSGLTGNGSSASSFRSSNQTAGAAGYNFPTSGFEIIIMSIQNYSNSTTYKTAIFRNNNASVIVGSGVNLWRSTSAITSITILGSDLGSININAGSTFTLYGIQGGGPKAGGGNNVTTDGTYWYHTFTSSGVFTPAQALTCDYLVVAGGGGGGAGNGSGGGAGGLRSTVTASGGSPGTVESALSLTASTNYTVTVGAGGAKAATSVVDRATQGGNSVFSTITSTGGGGGTGQSTGLAGMNGGSGSGGARNNNAGGSGTANQGFAGGTGTDNANYGAGGGGGASAVGGNGTSSVGGAGGAGIAVSISGSSVTYAGGGGGGVASPSTAGTGGAGGGSNGVNGGNASDATTNTGGGGGGAAGGGGTTGGNGGSGIVIVRYLA